MRTYEERRKIAKKAAANLKKARKAAGYKSASKFAIEHNLPIQTYLNHESGKRAMDLGRAMDYAELLGIDFNDLLIGVKYE